MMPSWLSFTAARALLAISICAAFGAVAAAEGIGEVDCVIEPKLLVKLGSPDTGIMEHVSVDRDKVVKKGEVVAKLESQLQQLSLDLAQLKADNDSDVQSARARLGYRVSDAERAITLHDKQIASTKTRDEAITEKELAERALGKAELEYKMAQVDLAQAQARLDRRSIRSPVDGVVADVTVKPGEYVYEQTSLMTIAEIDPLYVKAFISVRYYRQMHVGMSAQVIPEEPVGGLYPAKVTVVDRVFDTASSTFGVRLELPNPNYALPAGLRCRLRFLAQEAARP